MLTDHHTLFMNIKYYDNFSFVVQRKRQYGWMISFVYYLYVIQIHEFTFIKRCFFEAYVTHYAKAH